jgi:hypothetical protein
MGKDKRPSIKNESQYEALRDQGYSKEKSARIANANSQEAGKKGGKAAPYEEWTKEELYRRAKEIGLDGRSNLNKEQLIKKLRNH